MFQPPILPLRDLVPKCITLWSIDRAEIRNNYTNSAWLFDQILKNEPLAKLLSNDNNAAMKSKSPVAKNERKRMKAALQEIFASASLVVKCSDFQPILTKERALEILSYYVNSKAYNNIEAIQEAIAANEEVVEMENEIQESKLLIDEHKEIGKQLKEKEQSAGATFEKEFEHFKSLRIESGDLQSKLIEKEEMLHTWKERFNKVHGEEEHIEKMRTNLAKEVQVLDRIDQMNPRETKKRLQASAANVESFIEQLAEKKTELRAAWADTAKNEALILELKEIEQIADDCETCVSETETVSKDTTEINRKLKEEKKRSQSLAFISKDREEQIYKLRDELANVKKKPVAFADRYNDAKLFVHEQEAGKMKLAITGMQDNVQGGQTGQLKLNKLRVAHQEDLEKIESKKITEIAAFEKLIEEQYALLADLIQRQNDAGELLLLQQSHVGKSEGDRN